MKITRQPRNKMSKKFDTLKPITLEMLGTADDPCFGKHLDPKCDECQRCGDSEICSIVMMQNNNLKRAEIEATQHFKDVEEKDLKLADPKVVRKMVKRRVRELARMKPKGQSIDFIISDIHATYVMHGYTKTKIKRIITRMCEVSEKLSLKNDTVKYLKQ